MLTNCRWPSLHFGLLEGILIQDVYLIMRIVQRVLFAKQIASQRLAKEELSIKHRLLCRSALILWNSNPRRNFTVVLYPAFACVQQIMSMIRASSVCGLIVGVF
jgi:hypothetical protein